MILVDPPSDDLIKDLDLLCLDDPPSPTDISSNDPSTFRSTFIYIISNKVYSDQNMFKIGKHTGSKKGLIRRYKTYLIDPVIYLFFATGTSTQDENILLQRLSNYRVGSSEFIQLELETLIHHVQCYYKQKYIRNPCIKLDYPKALVCEGVILDLENKKLQNEKCIFFPNLNLERYDHCLDNVSMVWQNKEIFNIRVSWVQSFLDQFESKEILIHEFIRCFMIQFEKMNSYLYLHSFLDNGWVEFFKYAMEVLFSYQKFQIISRKDFLNKESFHERLIFVKKDDTPLEFVLTKAQLVNVCLIFEDQNNYSIIDTPMDPAYYEHLIYYFFYLF